MSAMVPRMVLKRVPPRFGGARIADQGKNFLVLICLMVLFLNFEIIGQDFSMIERKGRELVFTEKLCLRSIVSRRRGAVGRADKNG